jgi:hypothetical protein
MNKFSICIVSICILVAISIFSSCGGDSPTSITRYALSIGDGYEVTVFTSDASPQPSIVVSSASDCDASSDCETLAYLTPGGAGGAGSATVATIDAPLCASVSVIPSAISPTPDPCYFPDGARGAPSALVAVGVVAFYPDATTGDAVLALVQNPCVGSPFCATDADCEAGQNCDARSGCCETPGSGALLGVYPVGGGAVGAFQSPVPRCTDASPPCWLP